MLEASIDNDVGASQLLQDAKKLPITCMALNVAPAE